MFYSLCFNVMSYKEYLDNINKVYGIIKEYFGEDRTDLQVVQEDVFKIYEEGISNNIITFILIYFPEFTITNEFGENHIIRDLYVRLSLRPDGTPYSYIEGQRTTFTEAEVVCGYIHSHLPVNYLYMYKSFCLGSAPIKDTLLSLNDEYSEDLWLLFCGELEEYLKTESLSGPPYIGMSKLSNYRNIIERKYFYGCRDTINLDCISKRKSLFEEFLRYFFTHVSVDFYALFGQYNPAMNITEFSILLSNSFFKFCNSLSCEEELAKELSVDNLIKEEIICPIVIKNGRLYASEPTQLSPDLKSDRGIVFKNKVIPKKMIKSDSEYPVYGLSPDIVNSFYSLIYKYVNCYSKYDGHGKMYCI